MAEASRRWGVELDPERSRRVAEGAVTYARDRGPDWFAILFAHQLQPPPLRHSPPVGLGRGRITSTP